MKELGKKQIRFSQLHITVQFTGQAKLPRDKESAIRGGMGQCLMAQNCIQGGMCERCSFQPECIVQKIMYAPYQIKPDYVTKESMGYTLYCFDKRTEVEKGDLVTWTITLFGYTLLYFSQILNALHELGQRGLGKDHAKYQIVDIRNRKGRSILAEQRIFMKEYLIETLEDYVEERLAEWEDDSPAIRIWLQSPFCSKYRCAFINSIDEDSAQGIINAMTRRFHMLMLYEGISAEEVCYGAGDYLFLGGNARQVQVKRYSNVQDSKMELRGITGYLDLKVCRRELLAVILAGELTQVGKNTRFGFGVYRVEGIRGPSAQHGYGSPEDALSLCERRSGH